MIFFTNSFCTIFSNALKYEVFAKYEVYRIHRGLNIKLKSENQKRKTLKYQKDIFENKLTFYIFYIKQKHILKLKRSFA